MRRIASRSAAPGSGNSSASSMRSSTAGSRSAGRFVASTTAKSRDWSPVRKSAAFSAARRPCGHAIRVLYRFRVFIQGSWLGGTASFGLQQPPPEVSHDAAGPCSFGKHIASNLPLCQEPCC